MNTYGIIGATGALGDTLAHALSQQGETYRVIARSAQGLADQFGAESLAEQVVWNPQNPHSVESALRGVHTAFYCVGVDYWRFEQHPVLMRATLDGAIRAGVRRIVLIGTVYPYGLVGNKPVQEGIERQPHTFKGKMRLEQENVLWDAHRSGKIEVTILRLPDFFGPGVDKSLLHGAFVAGVSGAVADMLGPLDRPHQFAYVPDVGAIALRLAQTDGAYGRDWHFAGSGVTTQSEIVATIERETGRPLRRRVVGKSLLRLLGLFNPMMREMVEMNYLLTKPVLLDDSALEELIGPVSRTIYTTGIAACLEAARKDSTADHGREDRVPRAELASTEGGNSARI